MWIFLGKDHTERVSIKTGRAVALIDFKFEVNGGQIRRWGIDSDKIVRRENIDIGGGDAAQGEHKFNFLWRLLPCIRTTDRHCASSDTAFVVSSISREIIHHGSSLMSLG
eukprot:gb/GECG01004897.1/.p1 GENE.gb/GECG01004897.1/~~gb/GECG01004897.1/.p1  ORF type:complete len:110 (+),score=11.04 gb/GECG01004897.1/:1-330(+)